MRKSGVLRLIAGIVLLASGAAGRTQAQDHVPNQIKNAARTVQDALTGPTVINSYTVLFNFRSQPTIVVNGGPTFDPLLVQGLVVDNSGVLYGESQFGGHLGCVLGIFGGCQILQFGSAFKLDQSDGLTRFPFPAHIFPMAGPVSSSAGPMVLGSDGKPITATFNGGLPGAGDVVSVDPLTGTFTTLHDFAGEANPSSSSDGAFPNTNVIRDFAGNLYGTTLTGGVNSPQVCGFEIGILTGCGVVYKLDAQTHQETILHSFSLNDGDQPFGLARDSSGNLIGASNGGGTNTRACAGIGCGLIFRINSSNTFSILHEFQHSSAGSSGPAPELMGWQPNFVTADEGGNIFGVTGSGGNFGLGVVFKIDRLGNYSVLHHWAGPGDGFNAQQILLKDGKLYGINSDGGDVLGCSVPINSIGGCGTLWMVDTFTNAFTVLHTFSKIQEGAAPTALAFDQNDDLVGSNFLGAAGVFDQNACSGGGGCGNLFRFTLH